MSAAYSKYIYTLIAVLFGTVLKGAVPTVPVSEVASGRYDNISVRVVGTVRDAFRDEVDATWAYFVLSSDGGLLTVTLHPEEGAPWPNLNDYIGACVAVVGTVTRSENGERRYLGRVIKNYRWSALTVLRPRQDDPFTAPELSELDDAPVASVDFSQRYRALGHVMAVWHGDTILLRRLDGPFAKVTFSTTTTPSCGDLVEVVGFPETDLYRFHLNRAIWRKLPDPEPPVSETSQTVDPERLLWNEKGVAQIDMKSYGCLVRFQGIVPRLTERDRELARFDLQCGADRLTVDATACPSALDQLTEGATVAVTGVFVVDTETWARGAFFPRTRSPFVVLRNADDLVIVARAPWWTFGKLLVMSLILVIILIGVIVWNLILNRLVERRSRALLKEQVARVGESLRVDERTRLAVELHDSVAQSLSGVALQLDAAGRLADLDLGKMRRRLELAGRTLFACRQELRNCLWDLRSDALSAKDMNEAIRLALNPVIGETAAVVRFNVPRAKLSDRTAHALMRIIRELASNAVRHGHAKNLKVAGAIEEGKIYCSVVDDGIGFDPDGCPGSAEGHFGLQGIRERLRGFAGELTVESAPGKGTRVKVVLT